MCAVPMPRVDFPATANLEEIARQLFVYDYGCGVYSSVRIRYEQWRSHKIVVPDDIVQWMTTLKAVVDRFHFGSQAPSGGHTGSVGREHCNPHHCPLLKSKWANDQVCEQKYKIWNQLQSGSFKLTPLNFEYDLLCFSLMYNMAFLTPAPVSFGRFAWCGMGERGGASCS